MSRAVMQQAFDAMSYGNTDEREAARIALRDALAQPDHIAGDGNMVDHFADAGKPMAEPKPVAP